MVSPPAGIWRTYILVIGTLLFVAKNSLAFTRMIPSVSSSSSSRPSPFETTSVNANLSPRSETLPSESTPLFCEQSDDAGQERAPGATGKDILSLAVPALGALLIDPLMTLADTAFVGRYAETSDALAGMGSAAALLNFSFYLFGFFCTATTPLVASNRSSGNEGQAIAVGGQALTLSLAAGAVVTAVLLGLEQPLLSLMGTGNTGPAANSFAMDFLSWRALAAPAVLFISASTGVLRGYLDTKTPICVLVIANMINLVLDFVLIAMLGMGPQGAAIATTTAEWISAALFFGVLSGRLPSAEGQLGSNHQHDAASLIVAPTLSIPPWEDIRPLLVASASLFLRSVTLQIALSSAAALAARDSSLSASVAAHQIAIQLWLLCSFIADALAAASQAMVADALGRGDKENARFISLTVFAYSGVLGLLLAGGLQIGESSGFLLNLFTQDAATQNELSTILSLIVFAQPLNTLVFAADGVLQGASEFAFQAKSMALSAGAALCTFLLLQQMYGDSDTLLHVWSALIALQLVRGLTSMVKIVDEDGPLDLLRLKSANTRSI